MHSETAHFWALKYFFSHQLSFDFLAFTSYRCWKADVKNSSRCVWLMYYFTLEASFLNSFYGARVSIKIVHACNDNDISFLRKLTRYLSFGRYFFYHKANRWCGGTEKLIERRSRSGFEFIISLSLSELKIIVSERSAQGNKFINLIFHPLLRWGKENVER